MATFLNVYNRDLQKTAVLQNASSITETRQINQIYHLTFDLPATDEKAEYLQPFHYVRYGEDGELYRIVKLTYAESEIGTLHTECEHVIATLIDTIMFGYVTIGGSNLHTAAVLRNLLNRQKVKNWELGTCDLDGQFEYGFEQENLLNAVYSVPKCFVDPYYWDFDTSGSKWMLHLRKINASINPEFYIRAKSNLLAQGNTQENSEICTRIYPLGYGEGVNQLTIKDVNNGVAYLENTAAVAQYGVIEKVLVDRRFENASSLKAYAQSVLDKLSVPGYSRTFDVVDLYPITGMEIDNAQVGKICKMTGDGSIAYITKTVRVLDDPGNLKIELSTQATDVVSTIADLADRVRIESVYSQGATQLYQHSKDANATKDKGMIMSLYFPSEMKQINKVLMRLKLGKFRSYSQATDSKTVTVKTFENVKVTVDTNENALTSQMTSLDGGGTTSSDGGTSVTVGGGATSTGKSTGSSGVSVSVSASGTVSAPMETKTSQPSTDITSGTVWAGQNSGLTTTGYTPSGAVEVDLGDDSGQIYGSTYAIEGSDYDGLHSHDQNDIDNETNSGNHIHPVGVNIGTQTAEVKLNDTTFTPADDQNMHLHYITFNSLAHSHNISHYHTVTVSGSGSGGSHSHSFTLPNHTHTITPHSHKLPDLTHKHSITLNGHTHDITLNSHSHAITAGIFESGNPTAFDIYVKNEIRATVNAKSYNGDITQWLLDSNTQTIPRNTWIDVEIRPNSLAYVQASVFVQGFVQSRGGGNY